MCLLSFYYNLIPNHEEEWDHSFLYVCTHVHPCVRLWKPEVNLPGHSLGVVYFVMATESLVVLELTH